MICASCALELLRTICWCDQTTGDIWSSQFFPTAHGTEGSGYTSKDVTLLWYHPGVTIQPQHHTLRLPYCSQCSHFFFFFVYLLVLSLFLPFFFFFNSCSFCLFPFSVIHCAFFRTLPALLLLLLLLIFWLYYIFAPLYASLFQWCFNLCFISKLLP